MVSRSILALLSSCLVSPAFAHYKLTSDYSGPDFFEHFDLFSDSDPTQGHVKYVDANTANQTSLAGFLSSPNTTDADLPVYLGVDSTNVTPNGRPSVRISSKDTFNHSLIIADIHHMPAPVCGTWPAYWLLGTGREWPSAGEVDILENVNDAKTNAYTVHTDAGVSLTNITMQGSINTYDCDIHSPNQPTNVGCSITEAPSVPSYGDAFNANGGGIFAVEITSAAVRIWFFPRDAIPADIQLGRPKPPTLEDDCVGGHNNTTKTPSPLPSRHRSRFYIPPSTPTPSNSSTTTPSGSTWGTPNALFAPTAPSSLDAHISNLQIIFDTTFCGDWAGKVWSTNPSCAALAPTCEEYVSNNPTAFEDVFWQIGSVKVYTDTDADADTDADMGMKKRSVR